jgi:hypothetical protein
VEARLGQGADGGYCGASCSALEGSVLSVHRAHAEAAAAMPVAATASVAGWALLGPNGLQSWRV